jgi:hypothetical protein
MSAAVDVELEDIVDDFAAALARVDETAPTWKSTRSGTAFQPGIGPHPETEATRLIVQQMAATRPTRYGALTLGMPYPAAPRQRCDVVIGEPASWAVEVKLLRMLGDNGKLNDNMLMHVLSPYPAHRSALTDVAKLAGSGFGCRRAVLIYGFDYPDWPMDPAIDAFERLAAALAPLSERSEASFGGLVHPVQQEGRVFAWQVLG